MAKTKEEILAKAREWKAQNKERCIALRKKHYEKNKEIERSQHALWIENNKDKYKEGKRISDKKYREKNLDRIKLHSKKPEVKKRIKQKNLDNYRSNKNIRNRYFLRAMIWQTITGHKGRKYKRAIDLLGGDISFVRNYLEERFKPGMSWENYGEWHIDHIIPVSSFDLTDTNQQFICFNYKNIQPLWASENMSKGNRIKRTTE